MLTPIWSVVTLACQQRKSSVRCLYRNLFLIPELSKRRLIMFRRTVLFMACTLACIIPANAGLILFTGSGGTNVSGGALTAMQSLQAAIGGANNGVGGSFGNGFRAINWDGVPDAFAAPNSL